jgi:hypothetical protein
MNVPAERHTKPFRVVNLDVVNVAFIDKAAISVEQGMETTPSFGFP